MQDRRNKCIWIHLTTAGFGPTVPRAVQRLLWKQSLYNLQNISVIHILELITILLKYQGLPSNFCNSQFKSNKQCPEELSSSSSIHFLYLFIGNFCTTTPFVAFFPVSQNHFIKSRFTLLTNGWRGKGCQQQRQSSYSLETCVCAGNMQLNTVCTFPVSHLKHFHLFL